jgi:hypothetical protein
VLDAGCVVRAVNHAWREFGRVNRYADGSFGVGLSYLDVCESAKGGCHAYGIAAANGVREVASGWSRRAVLDYPCHSPDDYRWFRMTARPLEEHGLVLVEHDCITETMLARKRTCAVGACAGCGATLPLLRPRPGVEAARWACARCGRQLRARLDRDSPRDWLARVARL